MIDQQTYENDMLAMTVGIVANYVGANKVEPGAVPGLIQTVYASLAATATPAAPPEAEKPAPMTAAQARKLITPTGIISLLTHKPFKSMKRHIATHGHSPESYRAHFGLPADFPMVHPDYAKARSDMAKSMGLGQGGRQPKKAAKAATKARKA